VAYGARLESVLGESPRGFESPILRQVNERRAQRVRRSFTYWTLWRIRVSRWAESYTGVMTSDRISADPARMAGAPTVRNTRVTVSAVLGQLAAGQTTEQVLADYPYLEREDILAVLAFAAENVPRELPFVAA
jgi:uncharacterized protein (DUF433 family)